MSIYSRYFLDFVRGLIGRWLHADAFWFHTRLVHIADPLRERDPNVAMAKLSLMADGFGGGTRMATALETFNDRYAKETLDSRSVVIVMRRLRHRLAGGAGGRAQAAEAARAPWRLPSTRSTALRRPIRWRAWRPSKTNSRDSDRGLTRLPIFPSGI
jgi:uncharacterized protein with von Willebrand factor type A (vWA) domain